MSQAQVFITVADKEKHKPRGVPMFRGNPCYQISFSEDIDALGCSLNYFGSHSLSLPEGLTWINSYCFVFPDGSCLHTYL